MNIVGFFFEMEIEYIKNNEIITRRLTIEEEDNLKKAISYYKEMERKRELAEKGLLKNYKLSEIVEQKNIFH